MDQSWSLHITPDGTHWLRSTWRTSTGGRDEVIRCVDGKWSERGDQVPPGSREVESGDGSAGHVGCRICSGEVTA